MFKIRRKDRGGLILFDERCPFCRNVSVFLEKLGFRRYPVQKAFEFLESIFQEDKVPFALYFIDDEGIYWGEDAVFRILRRKGFRTLSYLAYVIYPLLRELNRNAKEENRKRGICGCRLSGQMNFKGAIYKFEKWRQEKEEEKKERINGRIKRKPGKEKVIFSHH